MKNESLIRQTLVGSLSDAQASPLQKYQDLYIGSRALAGLLKYELLTFFLSPLPGALGLLLRKRFYRLLFARMGKGSVVGPYVMLRCPRRISMAENVFIDSNVVLDAKGEGSQIRLGNEVLLGKDTILSCASASIVVGNDVSIGPSCYIRAGLGAISIGSAVTIGAQTVMISGNPSYARMDVPMKMQVGSIQGVQIGNDVWIGVGARIVDGVHVGDGSVVGAGAVVVEDVPAYSIVAGVPARVIGTRK